jgi:hypothetical protein
MTHSLQPNEISHKEFKGRRNARKTHITNQDYQRQVMMLTDADIRKHEGIQEEQSSSSSDSSVSSEGTVQSKVGS